MKIYLSDHFLRCFSLFLGVTRFKCEHIFFEATHLRESELLIEELKRGLVGRG